MSSVRRAAFLVIAASILACSDAGHDRATRANYPIAIALVEGEPAVLFNPDSGLSLTVSDVTYDSFGRVRSYNFDFASTKTDTIHARIANVDTASAADTKRFEAYVGSDTLRVIPSDSSHFAAALIPKDPGGLRLKGAGSVETSFAYDDFGRQQVSSQQFTLGGIRWQATFTGQERDSFGRFESFQVRIERVAPK